MSGKQAPPTESEPTPKPLSKQAAKKIAKKLAKKLLEENSKKAQAVESIAPVATAAAASVPEVVQLPTPELEVENVVVEEEYHHHEVVCEASVAPAATSSNATEIVTVPDNSSEGGVKKLMVKCEEEERQCVLVKEEIGWLITPPRPFVPTSVIIKKAKRMLLIQQLLANRRTRYYEEILNSLDFSSFVVDPRTVNCPVFLKVAQGPLLLDGIGAEGDEEGGWFGLPEAEEDDIPSHALVAAASVLVSDDNKPPSLLVADPPSSPSTASVSGGIPPDLMEMDDASRDWTFNSHKKNVWMQKQKRSPKFAMIGREVLPAVPEMLPFGLPWSPIRTPCKFGSVCKKPGCQFTHPTWLPAPNIVPVY